MTTLDRTLPCAQFIITALRLPEIRQHAHGRAGGNIFGDAMLRGKIPLSYIQRWALGISTGGDDRSAGMLCQFSAGHGKISQVHTI